MSADLIFALNQLEKEKGIDKEVLIEAIEAALISAYKRNFGLLQNVKVNIDRTNGDVKVFALKTVKVNPTDASSEISLEGARKIDPSFQEADIAELEVTPKQFGRIAAQTAKQVVMQKIREAEREIIFNSYSNKSGEIVSAIVQRIERKNVIVDLGKTEAIILPSEQIVSEEYKFNDRIKVYITEVKKTPKGPQVYVSRTHPNIVKKLFELEVPEIHEGIVEIRSISREAGSRTKIAVFSKNSDVDCLGACVGQKGTRVQAIVNELRGEKIDIIKWSSNFQEYISSSLSPAKVIRVDINESGKTAKVTVPDFQLSLAIGKEGQNARLAARLTGWKIDIKSESQLRATIEQQLLNFSPTEENHDYKEEDSRNDINNLFNNTDIYNDDDDDDS